MKFALRILLVGFLVLFPSIAHAGGSDGPTPYAVSADGLQLPAGNTFPDGGHVNIRYTVDGVEHSAGIHFESLNNQPSGVWIGKGYLPWSALVSASAYCITWVQLGDFNEHFGEGGQAPVCTGTPDPGTPDPGTPDPETPDPGTPDPGTPDPETPDPGTPDPETPDPGTPDPGTPDPETSDPGTPDSDTVDSDQADANDQNGVESAEVDALLPNTGGPGLWIAVTGAAMIAAGIVVLRRRKAA